MTLKEQKVKKEVDVPMQLIGIEEIKISFEKEMQNSVEGVLLNQNDFTFEIILEQQASFENSLVAVIPKITIYDKLKETKYGYISVRCIFNFKDLQPFIKGTDLDLPEAVFNKLNSISISTVRGIMFYELKGTHLSKAILPLVDVSNFKIKL